MIPSTLLCQAGRAGAGAQAGLCWHREAQPSRLPGQAQSQTCCFFRITGGGAGALQTVAVPPRSLGHLR